MMHWVESVQPTGYVPDMLTTQAVLTAVKRLLCLKKKAQRWQPPWFMDPGTNGNAQFANDGWLRFLSMANGF